MAAKLKEAQVPEGTKTVDGEGFRFCMLASCDGEIWAEVPDEIELYRIIRDSGARKRIDIAKAIHAALVR